MKDNGIQPIQLHRQYQVLSIFKQTFSAQLLHITYILSFIMHDVQYNDVHSCILSAVTMKILIKMIKDDDDNTSYRDVVGVDVVRSWNVGIAIFEYDTCVVNYRAKVARQVLRKPNSWRGGTDLQFCGTRPGISRSCRTTDTGPVRCTVFPLTSYLIILLGEEVTCVNNLWIQRPNRKWIFKKN